MVLATCVPLLILGWRQVTLAHDGLRLVEQELEAAVVDQIAEEIELTFDELTAEARQASSIALEDRIPPEVRASMLRDRVGRRVALAALTLHDGNRAFIDTIVSTGREVPKQDTLDEVLANQAKESVARRLHTLADGSRAISLTLSEDPRLFVTAWVDLSALFERVSELSLVRFGVADRIDILYADGRGDVHPLFGERDVQRGFAGLLPAQHSEMFAQPFLRTAEIHDGEPLSATLRSVPTANLAVRVVRPTKEAFEAIERTKQQIALGLAFMVLVVVLAGVLLGRRIARPIAALVALVRRYAQRDWSAKATLDSGDEFEILGTALSSMAKDIQASEQEIERRVQVEAALGRYLPGELAKQIARGERSIALGGERRRIAVVFADVSNFTQFAESREVEEVVALLNELFAVLSEVVFRHNGIIDKFMGDCVMALFGAGPDDTEDPERAAIAAAEDMMRFVSASAEVWRERWNYDIKLGIGVAAGEALVGNLGSEQRIEFTAVGDTVNLASRLEGLARPGQVLVSQEVVQATDSEFEFSSLGKVPVRGKREEVELFALVTE